MLIKLTPYHFTHRKEAAWQRDMPWAGRAVEGCYGQEAGKGKKGGREKNREVRGEKKARERYRKSLLYACLIGPCQTRHWHRASGSPYCQTFLLPSKYYTKISPNSGAQLSRPMDLGSTFPPNYHCKTRVPRLYIKSNSAPSCHLLPDYSCKYSLIYSPKVVSCLTDSYCPLPFLTQSLTVLRHPNPPTPITCYEMNGHSFPHLPCLGKTVSRKRINDRRIKVNFMCLC